MEFRMLFLCFISLLMSCSENKTNDEEADFENNLKISYLSYWDSVGSKQSTFSVFDNIEIKNFTEQVSENEEINLLNIIARSDDDNSYIEFTVNKDKIGAGTLHNRHFNFILRWPAYNTQSNFYFETITSNQTEFSAKFEGNLEHWNENTQILQIIDVHSGTITLKF